MEKKNLSMKTFSVKSVKSSTLTTFFFEMQQSLLLLTTIIKESVSENWRKPAEISWGQQFAKLWKFKRM